MPQTLTPADIQKRGVDCAGIPGSPPPRRGYRYRGQKKDTSDRQEQLKADLLRNRSQLTMASSQVRDLTNQRSEFIGQAVRDGIPLRTIATATSETMRTVRILGLAYAELDPGQDAHKATIRRLKRISVKLKDDVAKKTALELARDRLLVLGYRAGLWDELEAANLSGVQRDHAFRLARGIKTREQSPPKTVPRAEEAL